MTKTDSAFKLLEEALKGTLLPTESGGCRRASADEFMLMLPEPKNGWWQFKHAHTRNYLFVHETGKVNIPSGQPFMRGYFDCPPEIA